MVLIKQQFENVLTIEDIITFKRRARTSGTCPPLWTLLSPWKWTCDLWADVFFIGGKWWHDVTNLLEFTLCLAAHHLPSTSHTRHFTLTCQSSCFLKQQVDAGLTLTTAEIEAMHDGWVQHQQQPLSLLVQCHALWNKSQGIVAWLLVELTLAQLKAAICSFQRGHHQLLYMCRVDYKWH